jgi:hypothetical protein
MFPEALKTASDFVIHMQQKHYKVRAHILLHEIYRSEKPEKGLLLQRKKD